MNTIGGNYKIALTPCAILCILIVVSPRVISSAGRAPALQAGCRRFEPVIAHQSGSLCRIRQRLRVKT